MEDNKFPFELRFYWLAFVVALGLRLFQLGAAPLADAEAGWALQALDLARGGTAALGAQPAYILLTSQLFSLFGDTNFLARLIPALSGSLIVWLPFYFRRWMGESIWLREAGVVLAFGLALDPGMVSLSRQAGSLMPAMAFTLLTLVALYNRRMVWLGIFAGLALLSGPALLQGVLILAVTWGLILLARIRPVEVQVETDEEKQLVESLLAPALRKAIPAFLLTLLVAGTLLLRAPQGLGALAETLPAYLRTWVTTSGIPLIRLPASVLVYEPLALIFALIALVRAWLGRVESDRVQRVVFGLGIWAAVAILLPLFLAGRQVGDLAWALIPLWTLASLEISHSLLSVADRTTRLVALCLALLLVVLAVTGWIRLVSIGGYQANELLYWLMILGAFLLGFVAVLLVAAGWSLDAAKVGVLGSLCVLLSLQLISNTVRMNFVHQNGAQELWSPSPSAGQVDLFLNTLADLSSWNTGLRDQLEIITLDHSPSLMWVLREFPNAHFETALTPTESPPVVITLKGADEPVLVQKYRGQDFIWSVYPGWQGAFPPDFINWYTFREAPLGQDQIILWARVDIFPGGASETAGNPAP